MNDNVSTNGSPPADFGVAGGIANSSGIVTITNSTVSGNSASNEGGGILSFGTLTIMNSTVSGNRAGGFGQNNFPGRGGGISADGTLTISNGVMISRALATAAVSLALASRSIIAPSVATLLRSAAAFPLPVASKSETRS